MTKEFFKMPEKIFGISSSLIKLFLLPVGIIVLFIISLGLIILPKFDSINNLSQGIAKVKSDIKMTDQKKSYLASIDQEELSRNESYLSSAVLQEKNSYLLVGVIKSIADKYGFVVKSFSVNPIKIKEDSSLKVADKDVATKLPIDMVLNGPEAKYLDLIKAIENSLPILFIDNFNIATKLGVSELSMTISSYYVADKADYAVGNLSLTDLQPTKQETDLLDKISSFDRNDSVIKTIDNQNSEGKPFEDYNRASPFGL